MGHCSAPYTEATPTIPIRCTSPVPSLMSPTKLVAILSGYHGTNRTGELVVLDTSQGWHEADGILHRIGHRGEPIVPVIRDDLVSGSWPKFLHPFPLSEKYFLVGRAARRQCAVGHLPGRRLRQHAAVGVGSAIRFLRADTGPAAREATCHSRPCGSVALRCDCVPAQRLRRPGAGGRAGGRGETIAGGRVSLRLSGPGRARPHRSRRALGSDADLGDRARTRGWLGVVPRAGLHADHGPAVGCTGQGPGLDAVLVYGHAGRAGFLRGLSRVTA